MVFRLGETDLKHLIRHFVTPSPRGEGLKPDGIKEITFGNSMKFSHSENDVVSCDNDVCFANDVLPKAKLWCFAWAKRILISLPPPLRGTSLVRWRLEYIYIYKEMW